MNRKIAYLVNYARIVFGSISIGFIAFLTFVVALVMLGHHEIFSNVMRYGGYIWGGLSILSFPIAKFILK